MDISKKSIEIFCCYAHKDLQFFDKLKSHLMPLQRGKLITLWADVNIDAGKEWEKEIHLHLNTAQIILLLVSPNFMDSEYCYNVAMQRAIERHEHGEARVIPIILCAVAWQKTPLGKLQALPTDTNPITSSKWHNPDDAFFDITEGIRKIAEQLLRKASDSGDIAITTISPVLPPYKTSESKPITDVESVLRAIDNIIYALTHFNSNPEAIYYIGQTLVECDTFLEDHGINDSEATSLINDLIEEIDTDERRSINLDPVVSIGKVRRLRRCLQKIRGRLLNEKKYP